MDTVSQPFSEHQNSIYMAGLSGQKPQWPITYEQWEDKAREVLSDAAYGYIAGGAGAEQTMSANAEALRRRRIVPRMLRDVSRRDLSVDLFGRRHASPVLLAPVGVQSIAHANAEVATAQGASGAGVGYVLSTASSKPMEEVALAAPDCPRWFQLYWPRDRDLAVSLLGRAKASGFSVLVVTLDTWLLAWRPRDLGGAFLPFLKGEGLANYFSDPVFRAALSASPEDDPASAVLHWVSLFSDPSNTWDDLAFLRQSWDGPIVLKGIVHPLDAERAVAEGMNGIVVSNHGGRQVDGAIGAFDALPAVVDRVAGRVPVLFDSGVRTGADVVKAVAAGVRAVLVGRPFVWGLAAGGADGVRAVISNLLAELDLTLALSGYASLRELGPETLC